MTQYSMSAYQRAELMKKQAQAQAKLDEIILSLTPEEGWPGKNETERSLAKERAMAKSEVATSLQTILNACRVELIGLNAFLDVLAKRMDMYRWMIRDQANVAAGGQTCLFEEAQAEAQAEAPAEVAGDQPQEQTEE